MTKEDRKNAFLYCKFRDEQFALYNEYAKRNGMMMNTLLIVNVLFYAKNGMTQKEICQRTLQSKQTVNVKAKLKVPPTYMIPVFIGIGYADPNGMILEQNVADLNKQLHYGKWK